MSTATKSGRSFLVVPAGKKSARCDRCRATIYWVHVEGRNVPVDCTVPGGVAPSEATDGSQLDFSGGAAEVRQGRGVSHHATCPPDGGK